MKNLVLAATVVLAACAGGGEIPELNQYLLRSDRISESSGGDGEATVGLGNLDVADYLDQLGLVLESSSGTFRAARYHQWAEPLRESMRGFMAEEISNAAGQPIRHRGYDGNAWKRAIPRRIDIHIDELHGAANGSARLVASWALIDNGDTPTIAEYRYVDSEPLSTDGYPALVRAEKRLLVRFAEAIATEL